MAEGSYIGLRRSDRDLLKELNAEIRKEAREDIPEPAQIARLTTKYGNADREIAE